MFQLLNSTASHETKYAMQSQYTVHFFTPNFYWVVKWMDGCTDTIKLLTLFILPHRIHRAFPVLSMNFNFSDLLLLHLEIILLCLAWGNGYLHTFWKPSPHCCNALLAQRLSGVSGLISKQTDLILMPCLQLFSPESLKHREIPS